MSGTRMDEFDVEPVDINTAGDLKSKTAIKKLCNELPLTPDELEVSQHFFHDNGLTDEVLPLVDTLSGAYKRLIDEKVNAPEWAKNPDLPPYIAKEKTRLLAAMKEYKIAKAKRFMQNNNDEYSRQCSAAQPNEYIQLTNTYYYIKKNIIIALYNAARDYYKIILKNLEQQPDELAVKIKSLNEKFAGIAHVDPQTQLMQPIEKAFQHFLNLPLAKNEFTDSFEAGIDALIKRCANVNNTLGQYGEAFRCVQKRLNDFNQREYVDPLTGTKMPGGFFCSIAAPGEDTKASLLLYIPLATTTVHLGSKIKSVVAGDALQFSLLDGAKKLEDKIALAKTGFHTQLKRLLAYIQKIHQDAEALLESNEKDFEIKYDRACYNIHAYSDLLREQANIHGRIEANARIIKAQLKQLEPKISSRVKFQRLASEHELDVNVDELEACVFENDADTRILDIKQELGNSLCNLSLHKIAIDRLVLEAFDSDSMFQNDTFFLQHTNALKDITKLLNELNDRINSTLIQANDLNEDQVVGSQLIEAFETFKHCQDLIEQHTANYTDRNLSLPAAPNAGNDILAPALHFYQDAHLAFKSLESAIKEQHAKILSTRTLCIKLVKQSHLSTLTKCLDQLILHSNHQLQEARQFIIESQHDTNQLLLCHLYVNAIFNFQYWQSIKKATDSSRDIKSGAVLYHIPSAISELVTIIKCDDFANWEKLPEQAHKLLEAIQTRAKSKSYNAKVENFLAYLRNPENIDPPNETERLRDTISELKGILQPNKTLFEPTIIRPNRLTSITPTPTFWERHPILKKSLIGLLVGAGIALLAAAVIGIIIATHGTAAIAITTALQSLAIAVGSTAAAVAVITAMAAGFTVVAATIGALIGLGQHNSDQPLPIEAPRNNSLLKTQRHYSNTTSSLMSDLNYQLSSDSEHSVRYIRESETEYNDSSNDSHEESADSQPEFVNTNNPEPTTFRFDNP